jgi:signal transduction histidine kinase
MPAPNPSKPTHASVTDLPHGTATAHQQQAAAATYLLIRAEEARAQADAAVQMRDDVLAAASHDLCTPPPSIVAHAQLMLGCLDHDEALAPEYARLHLASLLQAAQRMRTMVGEITDAAHLRMGQTLALDLAPVDVGEMVQTVVQDVAQANAAREVSPVVVQVATNVMVQGDRPRLERADHAFSWEAVGLPPGSLSLSLLALPPQPTGRRSQS